MLLIGVISALAMALIPIVVVLFLTCRRDKPAWQLALNVPAAVAYDLLLILLLARLMPLDAAAWVSKAMWIFYGITVLSLRRRQGKITAWPIELSLPVCSRALAAAVIALMVSLTISRPYAVWDREWHIPFVTSLRGETAPFVVLYEPWKPLFYHFGGHVVAAAFQTYSFGTVHSCHALSLVHDFAFFWFGACLALVLTSAGIGRVTVIVMVLLAMLFAGPVLNIWGPAYPPKSVGYSVPNFLTTSFRPHPSVAAMFMLPFVALPLCRLRKLARKISVGEVLFPLAPCAAALVVTDEFSVGLLGLSLGAIWLVRPGILGETRWSGFYVFVGLSAALILAFLVLKGAIGPGAPHYRVKFVVPQSPGFYSPSVPLTTPLGRQTFVTDLCVILSVFVGGFLLLVAKPDDATVGGMAGFATLSAIAIGLFCTFTYYNGDGIQAHRFVMAPMLFSPLFATFWLLPRPSHRPRITSLPALLMLGAIILGANTTLQWLANASAELTAHQMFPGKSRFYETNCRTASGGRTFSGKTETVYADATIVYLYAGCRPVFLSGPEIGMDSHEQKVGMPRSGLDALRELRFVPNVTRCARGCLGDSALTF